ncbi:zinc transporter ZIP1-like [Lycorma delicatula]|uniref:zinc transporter ZIP1-like n=1 Tax=Lycorma delicatula TaxID=130591 RepID=UPI003F511B5A
MGLVGSKIAALLLLTALRLGLGLSPVIIRSSLNVRKKLVDVFVSLCLCFGGGVLLATCFVHLIPEVRSALSTFLPGHKFPLAELLVCAGFFLVHLFDEIIVAFTSLTNKSSFTNRVSPIKRPQPSSGENESNTTDVPIEEERQVRSLLVVLALSFHSFIEGLAIGLEESSTDVWFLFLAVALHEGVILFSVGLDLVTSNVPLAQTIIYISVLALVSPAGILLGLLLTGSELNSHSISIAVVQGLAAGTILYVTFFEVLTRERYERCSSGLLAVLITLLGFLFMLALQLIGVHEHESHEHEHLDCQLINNANKENDLQSNFLDDFQY